MDILSHYKNSFTSSVCTTTPVLAVTSLGACSLFFYFSYLGSDEIATSENVLLALIFIAVALYFASKNKSLIHHAILLLKHSWDGNVKQFRFSKSPAKPVQWFIGDSDGKRTKVKKEKIVREGVEFYSNGDFYEGEFHEGRSNGPEWGVQINHSGIEPFRYSKCWLFYFKVCLQKSKFHVWKKKSHIKMPS
ncbi:putative MORN repeat-containing protein 1-like [Sesbania bispinosa]|nr:putative MORN repeat-containing protein 1-like [Sesbania bispinosa]